MFNSTETSTTTIAIFGTLTYCGGILGNLLCLFIFVPADIRRVSTGSLFLFLTISNNLHLLTLSVEFLDTVFDVRVFPWIFVRCRMIYYFQNIFRSLSSYIACTISVDRMCRVKYPARGKRFFTDRTVRLLLFIYVFTFALFYTFYLLPFIGEDAHGICSTEFNDIYHRFMSMVWPPLRAFLVCFIPASIMLIANVILWREVRASRRRVGTNAASTSITETMLIFLSMSNVLVFFLTQIPFHIYTSFALYHDWFDWIRTPILLWSSVYFGIGFYIYCLFSSYFRARFICSIRQIFRRDRSFIQRTRTLSQRFAY